jgi:hypothetical protein
MTDENAELERLLAYLENLDDHLRIAMLVDAARITDYLRPIMETLRELSMLPFNRRMRHRITALAEQLRAIYFKARPPYVPVVKHRHGPRSWRKRVA